MKDIYLREVLETPLNIINEDGSYNLGVFKSYFKQINFRDHKRFLFRRLLNNQLLTEWQAVEVLLKDIFIIAAVFKFNLINKSLILVYDRVNNKLYNFSSQTACKNQSHVSPSLENKSTSIRTSKHSNLLITNELNNSKYYLEGFSKTINNEVEFNFEFDVISKPSNIVIPMTRKHMVYTEKDFLQPKGYIKLNNKTYQAVSSDMAILDDHRGYYPLSSGYDWITCMTFVTINEKYAKFALNLTDFYKNIDPEKYNENGFWFEGEFVHLPLVHFERKNDIWIIKDQHNSIHLTFKNLDYITQKKDGILKIDYMLAIGLLNGFITINNNKIKINNAFSLGEKRITQILHKNIYNRGENMITK